MDKCLSSLKVFNKFPGPYYAEKFWPNPQKENNFFVSFLKRVCFQEFRSDFAHQGLHREILAYEKFQITSISFRSLHRKIDRATIEHGDISEDFLRSFNLAFSKIMDLI